MLFFGSQHEKHSNGEMLFLFFENRPYQGNCRLLTGLGMFTLPPEILARIYEFDGTFHEVWQRVLREDGLSLVMRAHSLDLGYTVRNYVELMSAHIPRYVMRESSTDRYVTGGRPLRINEKGRRCFASGPL